MPSSGRRDAMLGTGAVVGDMGQDRPISQVSEDEDTDGGKMVGRAGFEPATNWLKANCSTD